MQPILILLFASASLCFAQTNGPSVTSSPRPRPTPEHRPTPPRFVQPNFLLHANPDFSDYRPVVNAEETQVIFERSLLASPYVIKIYWVDIATGHVRPFGNFASTGPDWCWDRSGGQLT